MDIVNLIISLVSGAIGGNIAGKAFPEKDLGILANTIIGLIGGGASNYILNALGVLATASATDATGGLDIASILTTIGVSGVSGGVITALVTALKSCCGSGGCCKK